MPREPRKNAKPEKEVTRYSYDEVTEPQARQGSPHADREGCRRLCADPNSPRRKGNNSARVPYSIR